VLGAALPVWWALSSIRRNCISPLTKGAVGEIGRHAEKPLGKPWSIRRFRCEVLTAKQDGQRPEAPNQTAPTGHPGMRIEPGGTTCNPPPSAGVTSATSGTGANAPTSQIYVDGYYSPSNLSKQLELADITQVDVV